MYIQWNRNILWIPNRSSRKPIQGAHNDDASLQLVACNRDDRYDRIKYGKLGICITFWPAYSIFVIYRTYEMLHEIIWIDTLSIYMWAGEREMIQNALVFPFIQFTLWSSQYRICKWISLSWTTSQQSL